MRARLVRLVAWLSLATAAGGLLVVASYGMGGIAPREATGIQRFLGGRSAGEAMFLLLGPGLLLSLLGLALWWRLPEAERRTVRVAVAAPVVLLAIPILLLALYAWGMSGMGPG